MLDEPTTEKVLQTMDESDRRITREAETRISKTRGSE